MNENEDFTSDRQIPNERKREILRELVKLLIHEKLLPRTEPQVIVIAARVAWEEYLKMNVYICQPYRKFQPSEYVAFYDDNRIYKYIPRIEEKPIESVILSEEAIASRTDLKPEIKQRLINILSKIEHYRNERINKEVKIIFLSAPDGSKTK